MRERQKKWHLLRTSSIINGQLLRFGLAVVRGREPLCDKRAFVGTGKRAFAGGGQISHEYVGTAPPFLLPHVSPHTFRGSIPYSVESVALRGAPEMVGSH